ncbi:hypothetical protein [Halorubrum yunnanense]|uniref:Uncharacterized protein n=1 Tax=Halorubrum yunnanense TaxID=1526162 RepID=A0ABD5YG13_9EURY|nr:hypothetical protein [Halorubrum yunnanense]
MEIEIDGIDEAIDTLEDMEEKAEEIDGDNDVPLNELFTNDFLQRYTEFASLEEFFEESPWVVESDDDIDAIPQEEMDEYVNEHTTFDDTDEMTGEAATEWAAKQLGFSPD